MEGKAKTSEILRSTLKVLFKKHGFMFLMKHTLQVVRDAMRTSS